MLLHFFIILYIYRHVVNKKYVESYMSDLYILSFRHHYNRYAIYKTNKNKDMIAQNMHFH